MFSISRDFYTWKDEVYKDFMVQMLSMLEPQMFQKQAIIVDEFSEQSEVFFVMTGAIAIGYEVNKIKKYCMR